ncbi:triose-phosphate isomerase [Moraxella atlantae]|uniref:triose-phosphate isomerase n=1 Tax=Faucicola atlantae TaxID=34059 RepID=UPI0037519EFC
MSISAIQPTAWVIANWKMHPANQTAATNLANTLCQRADTLPDHVQVVIAPSFLHLTQVGRQLEHCPLALAAQDVCAHRADTGAFTGDISAQMLADVGVKWVIIGHSERREYASENNTILAQKIANAQQAGLGVVLCVGETQAQFEAGQTHAVLAEQLAVLKDSVPNDHALPLLIAYEPVWAIGSGQIASPEQASAIHGFIHDTLTSYGQSLANTPILYGGSVKADNAAAFAQAANVAGVLVGGASLDAASFYQIIQAFA